MVYAVLTVIIIILLAVFAKSLYSYGLRGLVTIALLSAAASLGRALFSALPSVQPASFIIIIAGQLMGPGAGFAAGLLAAVISSLLTSVTPFTAWQVFLWGVMGLTAGLIPRAGRLALAGFGAAWGIFFGWAMNFSYYTLGFAPFSFEAFAASCAVSLPMDIAHASSNALLALALPTRVKNRLAAWAVNTNFN